MTARIATTTRSDRCERPSESLDRKRPLLAVSCDANIPAGDGRTVSEVLDFAYRRRIESEVASERSGLPERARRQNSKQMTVRKHRRQLYRTSARVDEKRVDTRDDVGHRFSSGASVPECPIRSHRLDLGRR